jgi:hypothetical protein
MIADDLLALFRRFISAGDAELTVLALWALHTHCFDVGAFTPYLAVTSAEKGSGKTRVLDVLRCVVREPLMTTSISPAALARSVEKDRPTLLLDELDAALKGDKELAEALRGILDGGFDVEGRYTRMVGVGTAQHPHHFSTFCPKALAGIGSLPDTVTSRAIIIRLERSPRGERERFRPYGLGRKAKAMRAELNKLRDRAAVWAAENRKTLADAEPDLPQEFQDRQCDIAEPILAIADLLGDGWQDCARRALLLLFTGVDAEDSSIKVRLLADIRGVFESASNEKMSSADLVEKLADIETSSWGDWRNGKPLTVRDLARLLKPFHITPKLQRSGAITFRGYDTADFAWAWSIYLPTRDDSKTVCNTSCNTSKTASGPAIHAGCNTVTDKKGGRGEQRLFEGEEGGC